MHLIGGHLTGTFTFEYVQSVTELGQEKKKCLVLHQPTFFFFFVKKHQKISIFPPKLFFPQNFKALNFPKKQTKMCYFS